MNVAHPMDGSWHGFAYTFCPGTGDGGWLCDAQKAIRVGLCQCVFYGMVGVVAMIARQRQNEILHSLKEEGTVSVSELADKLGVSESTVRRDLGELSSMGLLEKVHGGATALDDEQALRDLTLDERVGLHKDDKQEIARFAAKLVGPNDCVYLDAGTTTRLIVEALDGTKARYVTDSVTNALSLAEKNMKVVLVGGELKSATEALVGPEALETLLRYHFTLGFWGSNGIDATQGFTTPDCSEAMVKRISLEHCERPYVVADPSKFGHCAAVSFGDLEKATVLTTQVPPAFQRFKNIKTVLKG